MVVKEVVENAYYLAEVAAEHEMTLTMFYLQSVVMEHGMTLIIYPPPTKAQTNLRLNYKRKNGGNGVLRVGFYPDRLEGQEES
jgi:hypothetical protein